MAEFKVVIDGVELSDEQRATIDHAIQQAVLPHLAELDFRGHPKTFVIPDRLRWRGIWIGPLQRETLAELPGHLEKHFGERG